MTRIVRTLWNSPTFTQWLNLLTKPVRLFLLTPLVLTKFSTAEIDVFYILASVGGFAGLAATLMPGVFQPVLGYFFGGARDVARVGQQGNKEGGPNWEGFRDAFATLGRLQFALLVPLVLLAGILLYSALVGKLGSDGVTLAFWVAAGLLVVRSAFDLLVGRFGIALRSIGRVAVNNRIDVGYSLASVLISSLAIVLGGGLVAIVGTQLFVSTVQRFHVAAVARKQIPGLSEGRYQAEIFVHVRRPFCRATPGVLCSAGVEKLMPALLAGALIGGAFATYALSMNLALTILTASRGMLSSQMPAYIKLYAQGDLELLEELGTKRVGISIFVFLLTFGVVGSFFAWFLRMTGAKVELVSPALWALIGILLLLKHVSMSFAALYNVTNERPFYLRVVASGLIQLTFLVFIWATGTPIGLEAAILLAILPQVVTLNWAPLVEFSRLTSTSVQTIVADMIKSMRPDLVALHVHESIFGKKRVEPAS